MKAFIQKHYEALRTSRRHWLRKIIGVLLVIGGLLGFLPILGYWMLPLGLALLAVDWPIAHRALQVLLACWAWINARFKRAPTPTAARRRSASSPDRRSDP